MISFLLRPIELRRLRTLTGIPKERRLLAVSGTLLVAQSLILSMVLLSPSTSPIASIFDTDGDGVPDIEDAFPEDPSDWKDSDRDGVGDNSDAFPEDYYEHMDSDGDGVGDNADFMNDGNGGVRISLDKFEFEGYTSSCHRTKYAPDPWFQIRVDVDCDGKYDLSFESEVFFGQYLLIDFFEADVDLADGSSSFRFSIIAYDVWDVDNNNVTDFEILDYLPLDGLMAEEETVDLPCCNTWTYCGEGDTDAPDCRLEYTVTSVLLE